MNTENIRQSVQSENASRSKQWQGVRGAGNAFHLIQNKTSGLWIKVPYKIGNGRDLVNLRIRSSSALQNGQEGSVYLEDEKKGRSPSKPGHLDKIKNQMIQYCENMNSSSESFQPYSRYPIGSPQWLLQVHLVVNLSMQNQQLQAIIKALGRSQVLGTPTPQIAAERSALITAAQSLNALLRDTIKSQALFPGSVGISSQPSLLGIRKSSVLTDALEQIVQGEPAVQMTSLLPQLYPERKRKNKLQLAILKRELAANPKWSKEQINSIAAMTGLDKNQVYKWWWDQSNRKRH